MKTKVEPERVAGGLAAIMAAAQQRVLDPAEHDAAAAAWVADQERIRMASADSDREEWAKGRGGIPGRHLRTIVAGAVDTRHRPCAEVARLLDDPSMLVLGLVGGLRTGKTLSACWGVWEHKRRRDVARIKHPLGIGATDGGAYVMAPRLASMLPSHREVYHSLPIVAVDLVGQDRGHDAFQDLLAVRFEEGLPTIFCSARGASDLVLDPHIIAYVQSEGRLVECTKQYRGDQHHG